MIKCYAGYVVRESRNLALYDVIIHMIIVSAQLSSYHMLFNHSVYVTVHQLYHDLYRTQFCVSS